MARVKGGLFTSTLDVSKRFPLDSRMLVTKREDLINPTIWLTNTLTTEATYNGMIVSVSSDGVYYLTDRTAVTADNYSAYQTALAAGEDVESYFSMWKKLGTLDDLAAIEEELNAIKEQIGTSSPTGGLTPVDGTISITDGGKGISVAISKNDGNALVAVEGGLFVPTQTAGNGIDITNNIVSVKLADVTHGLVAVNGALTLNLATHDADGAMSKEDKLALDTVVADVESLKGEVSDLKDDFAWGQW